MFILGETTVAVHDEGDMFGDMALLHDIECQFFECGEFEHDLVVYILL